MKFKCLGIECTAHTFGASVVEEKGNILSEVRDMYTTEKGGIIPIDAAKHHKEVRKLDLTRPASRKYPRAYIQAVCAQIDRVLNRQELHLLIELLVGWKKQRLSA